MIEFLLRDFPKFTQEYMNDPTNNWDESLRNAGYLSAGYNKKTCKWTMDDEEFTWFALRWS